MVNSILSIQRPHYITSSYTYLFLKKVILYHIVEDKLHSTI